MKIKYYKTYKTDKKCSNRYQMFSSILNKYLIQINGLRRRENKKKERKGMNIKLDFFFVSK
jgi:hypothetical protein